MMNAKMFVIPNEAIKLSKIDCVRASELEKLRNAGMDANENDWLVQIWVSGAGCDNWGDHMVPGTCDYFTSFIPAKMLDGVKEGDSIFLNSPKYGKIKLTAQQIGFRYERFGKFEDVVNRVLSIAIAA